MKKRRLMYHKRGEQNTDFVSDDRPGKAGMLYVAKKATARRKARELRQRHPDWAFVVVR